jgi:hypothetical protein
MSVLGRLGGVGIAGAAAAALVLTGCQQGGSPAAAKAAAPALEAQAAASPCGGIGVQPVSLKPVVPVLFGSLSQQRGADCLAWQTFIALNWIADPNNAGHPLPNAPFGAPGSTSPVVWETFHEATAVFSGQGRSLSAGGAGGLSLKSLVRNSKFDGSGVALSGIGQAGPGYWLTSQSGELTFYEVRMNQDEFMYITKNVYDLTTASGQQSCATAAGGFVLPAGGGGDKDCNGSPAKYGDDVGAIEIKAAWVPLPADGSLNYRYKTSVAQITDPYGNVSRRTVGLVGLHIIRRLKNAPQLLWATFEQVDNTPDAKGSGWQPATLPPNPNWSTATQPGPKFGYTYFNTNCNPATDRYQCALNKPPAGADGKTPFPCDSHGQPQGCYPYNARMQVVRRVPVDATDANPVTAYVWSLLTPNSVFNYYRLINVQWPQNPASLKPGSAPPLPTGTITPSSGTGIVANATLETFEQDRNSCMDCHQYAGVAKIGASRGARLPPARRNARRVPSPAATASSSSARRRSAHRAQLRAEAARVRSYYPGRIGDGTNHNKQRRHEMVKSLFLKGAFCMASVAAVASSAAPLFAAPPAVSREAAR